MKSMIFFQNSKIFPSIDWTERTSNISISNRNRNDLNVVVGNIEILWIGQGLSPIVVYKKIFSLSSFINTKIHLKKWNALSSRDPISIGFLLELFNFQVPQFHPILNFSNFYMWSIWCPSIKCGVTNWAILRSSPNFWRYIKEQITTVT